MQQYFDKEKFAKFLKTHRVINLDIGVREAAHKIGIGSSTVSRIENEHLTDIDTILKICTWLNVSITEFIKTKNEKIRRKKKSPSSIQ